MERKQQFLFWIGTAIVLTLLFSTSLGGVILAFFFATFLLPIAIGTSMFFNHYLVPQFLKEGGKAKFILHFVYMFVLSVYLEMLVIILAFVILADYQLENLGKIASDIYLMAVILYLVVFSNGFLLIFKNLKLREQRIAELEEMEKRNQTAFLTLKVDRKSVQLDVAKIKYVESLSDYVKIHTKSDIIISKEKISSIEQMLPSSFMRIHRSFIVNRSCIKSFGKETIELEDISLTIGRKYKKEVSQALQG